MYTTTLKSTCNIKTNKIYYFQDICGVITRISEKKFEYLKFMCDRMDCFITKTNKTHVRHSACYYYEYAPF